MDQIDELDKITHGVELCSECDRPVMIDEDGGLCFVWC